MKKNYLLIPLFLLLSIGFTYWPKGAVKSPMRQSVLSIKQMPNRDCQFVMGDSLLEALVSPADGGKLVSLKFNGIEILTQSSTDTLAYGSTFWPSPHNWGWPPTPEIDRASYSSKIMDNTLIMEGQEIEKMGLKFIKNFTMQVEDTSIAFDYHIVNISDKKVEVAPWEVTRVPKGGFAFFPVDKDYPPFESAPSGRAGALYYCAAPSNYAGRSQKINFDAVQGWLAHADNGVLLVKKFEDLPIGAIAPKEGDVEIYIDDDADYIELENQGAFVELMPGDTVSYQTTWFLREIGLEPDLEDLDKLEQEVKALIK